MTAVGTVENNDSEASSSNHEPASQCGRILSFLKRHRRVTNVQLNAINILSYSARIKDLRDEGWLIETSRLHDGLWEFRFNGHRDDM